MSSATNGHGGDDIDYTDLEQKYSAQYESVLDDCVILDGAPIVEPARAEKLLGAVLKAITKESGLQLDRSALHLPMDEETGKSKGFLFVTLTSSHDAKVFTSAMHGYPFDKKHTFSCVLFSDVERYDTLQDEWVEPEEDEWKGKEHFRAWLGDPAGRDQLILFRNDTADVVWNGRNGVHEVAYTKDHWTDSYFQWSPFGTMLATAHGPGAALWAGPKFDRLHRFLHPGVQLLDFSPGERFFVTWSPRPIELSTDIRVPSPFTEDDVGHHIAVWDILSGALLRTFPMVGPNSDGASPEQKRVAWPMFKFSPDERYIARVTPGQQISVYELPSMALLGKKSIKIEGVVDFEWSPLSPAQHDALEASRKDGTKLPTWENTLAYWTPEVQNQPARVTLMNLPSRGMVRSKNLFNVHDCKIHWQSNGDYLCVKVDRHTKTKKTQYCNLELFRLREKDCPVQVIEIKDAVTNFAWEPKGDRFALITSSDPLFGQVPLGVLLKTTVSFYGYEPKKGDFLVLKNLEPKSFNTIQWSPKGRHVILAMIGSNSKFELEFWDLDLDKDAEKVGSVDESGIRMITGVEHYGMTDIEWDPSGRYVATSGSTWMNSMESGYAIWDFKGQELVKNQVDKFKQLLWRPRPPTLLSKEDQKRIRKNLREYSRQFEEQDQLEASQDSAELVAMRERLINEWNEWRRHCREHLEYMRQGMGHEDRAANGETEALEEVEEWVEEVISESIEEVK